ncbi:MAG: murein L,D-transpeptidase catalytic domain family protein [Flavobacteriales bacterium]|nr:murein L,D-transpeptidase catalytic domain family protein [Flavobacteriales bacterium]
MAIVLFIGLSSFANAPEDHNPGLPSAYEQILTHGLSDEALTQAIDGYATMSDKYGDLKETLVVIDYSKSSNTERMYILNMGDTTLTRTSLVAHGRNSGNEFATSFSNQVGSYQSSLGFFRTAETYEGKHGLSLRLDGLEIGINHKARERAIVIHKADYVSLDFAAQHGRIGRSLGCPALPLEDYTEVIEEIKEGCLLFIYGGDENYAFRSSIIAQS